MLYSAKTGGFYDREIHGNNIPADAVEITREEWNALLDGQSQGKQIVAGAGGKPELRDPEPPAPVVPRSVTPRQARLALLAAGHLQAVQEAMSALPEAAKIEWEYATAVERDSALVAQMGAALGLDDSALDALFTAAAAL
jgi:hypothetical protein